MKVMLIVPSLRKTGVTEVIRNFLLAKTKNEEEKTQIVLVALRKTPDYSKKFSLLADYLYCLKGKYIISPSKICKLNKIISYQNPDIIHFHGFNAEIYLPFIKSNAKKIATAHNMGKDDFQFSYGIGIGYIMSIIQLHLYRKLDLVIGVSKTVTDHYKKLGIDNTVTVYNGVSNSLIRRVEKVTYGINRPLGIYAGNLDSRKNMNMVFNVFEKIFKNAKDKDSVGSLVILGDNPKRPNIVQQLRKRYSTSPIYFEGRVDNVQSYFSQADYFISASKNEGLPMAVIEAMRSNLDLILSNIPQHIELKVDRHQKINFFSNDKELSSILMRYFDGKEYLRTHNNYNYQTFAKNFTATVMYHNYYLCYEKVLQNL